MKLRKLFPRTAFIIPAGGGFRYMLAEEQKLSLGIDAAYADGTEVSIYFQVGDWLAN